MTKLQTLASKVIGLLARILMRTASVTLTRRATLEFISSCLNWVVKKLKHRSLELTHESGFGDFRFAANRECVQLTFWHTEAIRHGDQQTTRNHQSFRSGMRATGNRNGKLNGAGTSDKTNGNASDNANDKAHDIFDHIVGDILDAVIGEANAQVPDTNGNQSSTALNRSSVNTVGQDGRQARPCACGRFSS